MMFCQHGIAGHCPICATDRRADIAERELRETAEELAKAHALIGAMEAGGQEQLQIIRDLRVRLEEATGLLRLYRDPRNAPYEKLDADTDAFLSGAPAREAEPGGQQQRIGMVLDAKQRWIERATSAEAKLATVHEHIGHLAQDVAAARKAREPQTGMHVPYHGDFAGANPTVIRQLERWVRRLQELLRPATGEKEGT